MLVGIVAANNLRVSPYVFYYTQILEELEIKYEILVPNRNTQIEDIKINNVHKFSWSRKFPSIVNYCIYSNRLKKYSNKRFDFLIVLTTNVAVFSSVWLANKFNKKYIVDIRDYTYENNQFYYKLEKRAISHAALRVISSSKYQVFLPESDYLVCHNNGWSYKREVVKVKKKNGRIVIGYVGAIAYKKQCKRMIDLVKEDDRFEFHFYGSGIAESELKEYVKLMSCDRIKFFGVYDSKEKKQIIEKIDILFNAYGNGFPLVDYALSNKLYDALYFCKPILNSPNTYMNEMSGPLSFAIDLEIANDLDELVYWYNSLDMDALEIYAQKTYFKIVEEEQITKDKIRNMFTNLKGRDE